MTDTQALIERLEAAGWKDQRPLLREAFDIIRPEPRKWDGFPWINARKEWVNWYKDWRWFEAALRIGAYESAALTLKRPGQFLDLLTECNVDELAIARICGTDGVCFTGVAKTLPNAATIAALRAHSTGMEGNGNG